jgi:hypothetical protein
MKNINIGIAKSVVSGKLRDDYISTKKINESKNIASHFYFLIENSEILSNQFSVYCNLEKKHIESDVTASKYIDDNLSNVSKYSVKSIQEANKRLESYITESDIEGKIEVNKIQLYDAINNLILENAKRSEGSADPDLLYESYNTVLNHIKTNKKEEKEIISEDTLTSGLDMDMIIELAINKFNSKYSKLDENELKIINILAVGDLSNKKEMFESLKEDSLNLISNIDKKGIEDKINETIDKISKMEYNDITSTKDVISLYELKNNLT